MESRRERGDGRKGRKGGEVAGRERKSVWERGDVWGGRSEQEKSGQEKGEVVGMYVNLLVTYNFIGHCFRLMSTGSEERDGHGMRR